ncbi:T9SS type A sorting domain-containing protein [Plebeiibacterium marinum]|uniref:T9SS type A sorting domain-containing protein n=1 Tax=Plebeiibacterium marinum TaxID=2992111 RepID=A0AAE3SL59_9BACT|nr:T9SS type A sorting domain-containing protein [Plebeiobacterium marinum]MCW3807560.1 T9SS type A sorting domain-containing protein [Plebeiobacterium marinum]
MNKISLFIIVYFMSVNMVAQTNLQAGDIAFVAINSDGDTDDFSFLLLKNIESNTSVNFTDNGWTAFGSFNNTYTESHITWYTPSELKAGTVVTIETYNGNESAVSSHGSITGDKMTISVAGDQILAYQGSKTNPVFIAAISFNKNDTAIPGNTFDGDSFSNSTTALPTDLSIGYSAIQICNLNDFTENDNAIYNCSLTSGDKNALLGSINNYKNWLTDNYNTFEQSPSPCEFTVDLSTSNSDMQYNDILITPNPAKTQVYISNLGKFNGIIKFTSYKGNTVKQIKINTSTSILPINIADLPSGFYLVQLVSDTHLCVKKISILN